MGDTKRDPVWAVYDKLRTASLSYKYYCCRLQLFTHLDNAVQITIAVTTPGSLVASLALWKLGSGALVWGILSGVASLFAAAKPFLGWSKKAREFEKLVTGYRFLEYDLQQIKSDIEEEGKYSRAMKAEFKRTLARERQLLAAVPEAKENDTVKAKCEAEVLLKYPVERFFVPGEQNGNPQPEPPAAA